MARYYGVNNSELYGSNFSTVLADAPPPLDDTFEEDENEFVFPSEGKNSKKYNGETEAPSIKKSHSGNEKFSDQSKPDGSQLPNGEHGSVEEDSDFGDFAGFADFGSAFGQEKSGESQNWFTGAENSVNSPQAVKGTNSRPGDVVDDNDDEFADFAGFQDNGSRVNQENIPNGSSEQETPNTSDVYNCNKNGLGNRVNSNDSSYDMDSDDGFGDFECVDKNTGKPGEITPESESKSIEIQPGLESNSTFQGRTCAENDKNSGKVDQSCQRNISQCNGDIADENVVSRHGESALNHTSEGSLNISGGRENEFETKTDINDMENVSNAMFKDKKSKSLDNSSLAVQHGDNVPRERPMAVPEREGVQLKINVEGDSRTNAENSETEIKSDETNITNANLSSASTCDHDSEDKTLPENSELTCNDDDFGEFADFSDPPMKQPSIDNDDDKEICNKGTPDSPGMCMPICGKENEVTAPTGVVSVQDNDDDDEFGNFGSFDKNHDQGSERTDDSAMVDSKAKFMSIETNDDDEFGEFGIANSEEKTLRTEDQDDDFSDFGALNSGAKESVDDADNDNNHFGDFGVSNSEEKTLPTEEEDNNDFGDFGAFNSGTKDCNDDDDFGDFSVSNSKGKGLPNKDQDNDFGDFSSSVKDSQQDDDLNGGSGGFGTFDSKTKDSNNDDGDDFGNYRTSNSEGKTLPVESQDNDDFGDFGTFDSTTKDSEKDDSNDDFGDFGSFESNTKDDQKGDSNIDSFGDFGAFDAQPKDSLEKNESDEFGNFSTFESKVNDVPKGEESNSNVNDFNSIKTNDKKIGDFRTADSAQNSQAKKKSQSDEFGAFNTTSKNVKNSIGSDDDFGDFSSLRGKEDSFQSFPASHSSVSAQPFPRKNEDLKQREARTFVPGNNVVIKQVGDPISLCFVSEQQHISDCQCDVLSSQVEKSLESNLGLWQQLERSDKEGRILFHWSNSFSQHKKLLSLMIRPERPPPLQGGAILKPMVSSNFAPFGGGLVGSMLMPEPSKKFPQFSSGLSFLEPVKGSQFPVQSTTQDKIVSHQSVHPEIGLPDLSFVLGNGLKRTASKSDIKDNVSDTTSESSSLDLDFFAPSKTQPSDGKSESRGLYEEELMGLNIFTTSVEPKKLDSPKPQKTSDTKKVWQHGGVTIPLSSQQSKAQLSVAAKSILDELEDLKFMTSSVLMFPLKNE